MVIDRSLFGLIKNISDKTNSDHPEVFVSAIQAEIAPSPPSRFLNNRKRYAFVAEGTRCTVSARYVLL